MQRRKKCARGEVKEWEDEGEVAWRNVRGICGLGNGSCWATGCGANMWVKVFTQASEWRIVNKKCEPLSTGWWRSGYDLHAACFCVGEWCFVTRPLYPTRWVLAAPVVHAAWATRFMWCEISGVRICGYLALPFKQGHSSRLVELAFTWQAPVGR